MTGKGPTIDDLLELMMISDAQINPDGRRVAFVGANPYVETGKAPMPPASSLYVAQQGQGYERLTTAGHGDSYPRWCPDGKNLAFLRIPQDAGQAHKSLFVLPLQGEAHKLPVPGNVQALEWVLPEQLFCLAQAVSDKPPDPVDFEQQRHPSRLWQVDIPNSTAHPLSPSELHVWEFHSAAEANQHVLLVSATPYEWDWYRARLVLMDEGGNIRPLVTPDPGKHLGEPQLSPSGGQVAYLAGTASDPGIVTGDLMLVDTHGGEPTCLTPGLPLSVNSFFWTRDDELIALGYQAGELALVRVELEGSPPSVRLTTLWSGPYATPGHRARFSIMGDGSRLALAREDDLHPADVWLVDLKEQPGWHQLTECNPQTGSWQLAPTETLTWEAEDGTTIQGLLVKPSIPSGELAPLFVNVHGGPTILHAHRFRASVPHWAQLLASQGICVLLPNPRGSAGWGTSFSNANIDDLGGGDIDDVLAGIRACVEQRLCHPERMALGGWSYGGYLSAWAAVKAPYLKGIIAGASITNWYSFHGTSNIPGFDETFLAGGKWMQECKLYYQRSPVMFAGEVTMPVLLLHGEKDPICDVGQAKEFYRVVRERGGRAQLIIYPREGHGIQEKDHVRDLLNRVVEFAQRHLGD